MGEGNGEQGPVLLGHFLTRRQVAGRVSMPSTEVVERPDLLRIGGTWLEEVYFGFQFDTSGVKQSLGVVVANLRRRCDDEFIADWLVQPHPALSSTSPLAWLAAGGTWERVTAASDLSGPHRHAC